MAVLIDRRRHFSVLLLSFWHIDKSFRSGLDFGKIILELKYPGKTVELAHTNSLRWEAISDY